MHSANPPISFLTHLWDDFAEDHITTELSPGRLIAKRSNCFQAGLDEARQGRLVQPIGVILVPGHPHPANLADKAKKLAILM
jgi:hypothetical protein